MGWVGPISQDFQILPGGAEAAWVSGLQVGAQVHTPGLETVDTGLAHWSLEFIPWRGDIWELCIWCKGALVGPTPSVLDEGRGWQHGVGR